MATMQTRPGAHGRILTGFSNVRHGAHKHTHTLFHSRNRILYYLRTQQRFGLFTFAAISLSYRVYRVCVLLLCELTGVSMALSVYDCIVCSLRLEIATMEYAPWMGTMLCVCV